MAAIIFGVGVPQAKPGPITTKSPNTFPDWVIENT